MTGQSVAQMNRISCLATIPMNRQCQTGSSAPGIFGVGGQVGISFISAKSTALCPSQHSLPAPKNLICVWKPATEAPWPHVSGLSQTVENTRIQVAIVWDPEMCPELLPRAAWRPGLLPRRFSGGQKQGSWWAGGTERVTWNGAEESRLSQREVADSVCDQSCLTKRPVTEPCPPQASPPHHCPQPIRRYQGHFSEGPYSRSQLFPVQMKRVCWWQHFFFFNCGPGWQEPPSWGATHFPWCVPPKCQPIP